MAAILNQIASRSFGFIHSGGSERERQLVIDGWRIYLHYTKKKGRTPVELETTRC